MTHNVGGIDRGFRVALGVAIIGVGVYTRSWWGVLGVIPLLTGIVGWCPVYLPFGTSTRAAQPGPRA